MNFNKITEYIIFICLIIIVSILLIVLFGSFMVDESDLTYDSFSNTSSSTYLTPLTLSPVEEGISSSSAQTYNQTWLDFDGVNDYVNGSDIGLAGQNISIIQGFKWLGNSTTTGKILELCNKDLSLYKQNIVSFLKITYSNSTKTIDSSTNYGEINNGLWTQSSVIYNGTSISIYQNTSLLGLRADIINNLNVTSNCYIGSNTHNFGSANISIDNYRIFNKSITQGTINYFYNSSIQGNNLGNGIPIYMLHVIRTIDQDLSEDYYWNISWFNDTVNYLYLNGYESITYQDYIDWVDGKKLINKKSFIFSFDDNHKSVYTYAYPIMQNKGYIGSISVISNNVGDETYHMNWTNINELKDNGWEIVSHSINTTDMINLGSEDLIRFALNQSRYNIYSNTSILPNVFVYPQSSTNSSINLLCLEYYDSCIYQTSETSLPEYNFKKGNYSLGINRINIKNTTNVFQATETDVYDKLLKELLFNENSGTIAYDSSGNGNNGTISGASWNNDGILVNLINGVDYTINTATGLFTIINNDYLYSWIIKSWSYDQYTTAGNSAIDGIDVLSRIISLIKLLITTVFFGAIIYIIINWKNLFGKIQQ